MKSNYIIVTAENLSELEEYVNESIDKGYIPNGGILYKPAVRYKETEQYSQAMILTCIIPK